MNFESNFEVFSLDVGSNLGSDPFNTTDPLQEDLTKPYYLGGFSTSANTSSGEPMLLQDSNGNRANSSVNSNWNHSLNPSSFDVEPSADSLTSWNCAPSVFSSDNIFKGSIANNIPTGCPLPNEPFYEQLFEELNNQPTIINSTPANDNLTNHLNDNDDPVVCDGAEASGNQEILENESGQEDLGKVVSGANEISSSDDEGQFELDGFDDDPKYKNFNVILDAGVKRSRNLGSDHIGSKLDYVNKIRRKNFRKYIAPKNKKEQPILRQTRIRYNHAKKAVANDTKDKKVETIQFTIYPALKKAMNRRYNRHATLLNIPKKLEADLSDSDSPPQSQSRKPTKFHKKISPKMTAPKNSLSAKCAPVEPTKVIKHTASSKLQWPLPTDTKNINFPKNNFQPKSVLIKKIKIATPKKPETRYLSARDTGSLVKSILENLKELPLNLKKKVCLPDECLKRGYLSFAEIDCLGKQANLLKSMIQLSENHQNCDNKNDSQSYSCSECNLQTMQRNEFNELQKWNLFPNKNLVSLSSLNISNLYQNFVSNAETQGHITINLNTDLGIVNNQIQYINSNVNYDKCSFKPSILKDNSAKKQIVDQEKEPFLNDKNLVPDFVSPSSNSFSAQTRMDPFNNAGTSSSSSEGRTILFEIDLRRFDIGRFCLLSQDGYQDVKLVCRQNFIAYEIYIKSSKKNNYFTAVIEYCTKTITKVDLSRNCVVLKLVKVPDFKLLNEQREVISPKEKILNYIQAELLISLKKQISEYFFHKLFIPRSDVEQFKAFLSEHCPFVSVHVSSEKKCYEPSYDFFQGRNDKIQTPLGDGLGYAYNDWGHFTISNNAETITTSFFHERQNLNRLRVTKVFDNINNFLDKQVGCSNKILNCETQCLCENGCGSFQSCKCSILGKGCSSTCSCGISCLNPMNVLQAHSVNVQEAKMDACLMQNIYGMSKMTLTSMLENHHTLSCCGLVVAVYQVIPNLVRCPKCQVFMCYSWCQKRILIEKNEQRNHCVMCGTCQASMNEHCFECAKCCLASSNGKCLTCF